jgi:peptidyl-prolyl cis-trans isomerase D
MAKTVAKKASNLFVWVILGLLFVALAGFGIGSFSGGASRVGAVGDVEVTAQDYALALQQEIRARIAETGQPVSLRDLQANGTDRAVLQSLMARAALSNEALQMGLSVGDAEVARQVQAIEAFQGIDGGFDREAYAFELRQLGLDIAEFEENLREDTARSLLQLAVVGGLRPNPMMAEAIAAFQGEARDATILTLTEADLPAGLPAPDAADLQAYYEENPQRFTRPEAKRIQYVWITPGMLMDEIEIDEADLRRLYEDRAEDYIQPERRLLERLVFLEADAAQAAAEAIAAGETDFDSLVAERGLSLEDVDLGDVGREALPEAAAEAIFGSDALDVFGPFETPLGPALYRVNAVLSANEVPFEEAQEELRQELAAEAARRAIGDMREGIDDLLAGGALLAELADTTDLVLGEIDYTAAAEDGIAAYDAFRAAARAVQEGDFAEVLDLSDGGIFALELVEVVPPTLPPLAEIEDEVRAGWRQSALRAQLVARGEALMAEIAAGDAALADLGPTETETALRRQDFVPDAPPTLVPQLFQLSQPGDMVLVPGADRAMILRLDAIRPAARDDAQVAVLLDILGQTLSQSMAQDVFEAYGQALQAEAGMTVDQSVVNAVHTQFP